MGLSRSFLRGMGLTDEQVSAIVEAHTETTDALKEQRDQYKANSDKLSEVQAELDALKGNGNDWKVKYEQEHEDFEAFKTDVAKKSAAESKEKAYTKLLRELGVTEKRISGIIKLTDMNALELDENGSIKDLDSVKENIKAEWSDFIPTEEERGAGTETPPGNNGGTTMTKAEIMKIKDASERQKAIMEHPELFGY